MIFKNQKLVKKTESEGEKYEKVMYFMKQYRFLGKMGLCASIKDNVAYSRLNSYQVYCGYKHAMYNDIYNSSVNFHRLQSVSFIETGTG